MSLLEETLWELKSNKKGPADVRWVGSKDGRFTWEEFAKIAKKARYDSGYGAQEVARDLVVVGDDWWLERSEYDGSESWDYKSLPKQGPSRSVEALTVHQCKVIKNPVGWETLADLNGWNA